MEKIQDDISQFDPCFVVLLVILESYVYSANTNKIKQYSTCYSLQEQILSKTSLW